jgi:hypothetical protein
MIEPPPHRFYIHRSDAPEAKSEARCLDCGLAFFDFDENRIAIKKRPENTSRPYYFALFC